MQKVSPELFAAFCSLLPPADLFTLSQVCRKFREYLCAPNSFSTQQIWKESRLQFMPKEGMPPPEGMSEEKYVSLLMTERGCQFCKYKECKIYWEFEVRCCNECFSKKTISFRTVDFPFHYPNYPQAFLDVMPYIYNYDKKYWKEQIEIAYPQYKGLSIENLQSWLDDKKRMSDSLMKYAKQRGVKEEILFIPTQLTLSPIPFPPTRSPIPRSHLNEFFVYRLHLLAHLSKNNNMLSSHNVDNDNNKNSDESKRNNFIETKKKKNKREYYGKHNEFHMKGKIQNKFAYKYG